MSRRWDDATGVVTPEAVELRFHDATVGSRGAALLLDFTILAVTLLVLNLTIGWLAERSDLSGNWIATTALIVVNFVLLFGYPIAFETLTHGRTPGKAAMGLRAVTVEGAPVRFRHAAIRGAFWLVDFFATLGVGAVLASLLSRRRQRLGDMVAGTVVLRERTAAPAPRVARFEVPPGAADYAQTIDVSGLTARDYDVLREFLLRESILHGRKRWEIADRLATAIAASLHHNPPPGVDAVVFLTCVAARYSQEQRDDEPLAAPTPSPATAAAPPASALDFVVPAPHPPASGETPASSTDFAPPG